MTHSATNPIWAIPAVLLALSCPAVWGQDQPVQSVDDPNVHVLSRGPLHEAFAEPVDPSARKGVLVDKQPPKPIEEVAPDAKPAGNAVWIGGYWAWDDELQDFLWVSGVWRTPPPGQRWVPGYWSEVSGGHQWVPGFWTTATAEELTYLPEPPKPAEEGPSSPAPSDDYFWIPGCWVYRGANYAWRPGYWAAGQLDWLWVPDRYYWTPSGYVFCRGYWDFPLVHRGWCFAPVYFGGRYYARPGYYYRPSVVLDVGRLAAHLFVRPRWGYYYFGDYYAARYSQAGFYPWLRYGRVGYDPIFAYYRTYSKRRDPDWFARAERDFERRQRDERARPPHEFRGDRRSADPEQLAVSLDRFTSREDVRRNVERLEGRRLQDVRREQHETERFRDDRAKAEVAAGRGNTPTTREREPQREARRHTTLKLPVTESVQEAQRAQRRLEQNARDRSDRRADGRAVERQPERRRPETNQQDLDGDRSKRSQDLRPEPRRSEERTPSRGRERVDVDRPRSAPSVERQSGSPERPSRTVDSRSRESAPSRSKADAGKGNRDGGKGEKGSKDGGRKKRV